jgi:hypothetical protein
MSSSQSREQADDHVDEFDPDEWGDDPAEAISQQIASQQSFGTGRREPNTA